MSASVGKASRASRRFWATLVMSFGLAVPTGAQQFTVSGNGVMLDPSGRPWVCTGAAMIGRNPSADELDKFINYWRFNTVRVWWHYVNQFYDISLVHAMVTPFTSKKVVVLLDVVHDPIGSYRDGSMLAGVKAHWSDMATRYKSNPYVWFELMNEPGDNPTDQPRLLAVYQALIKVIRDDVGAQNPIVCDGGCWGQDIGDWGSLFPQDSKSFILTNGTNCVTFGGKTYANIVMAFHAYDQWNQGDAKMKTFFDKVQAKKLCLFNTEFGCYNNGTTIPATRSFLRLYQSYANICGWCVWDWDNSDEGDLTTGNLGSGVYITSKTNPTNLTEMGTLIFNEAVAVASRAVAVRYRVTSPSGSPMATRASTYDLRGRLLTEEKRAASPGGEASWINRPRVAR